MHKPILRIDFADFWNDFNKEHNFFHSILSKRFRLEISDNPDVLLYSCFGDKHLTYNCIRIFYTGENLPSNFNICDFSISFERFHTPKQYYFPFYALRVIEEDKLNRLQHQFSNKEALELWNQKTDFCCTVVSNPRGTARNLFFNKLNQVKRVNSGGRFENNIGGPIEDKEKFCEKHKLTFAFENEEYPGYTTEKLTDAILSRSIPIYFGDPLVHKVFNANRFIHARDFTNHDELIKHLIEVSENQEKWISYIAQPVFSSGLPEYLDIDNLLNFFDYCIEKAARTTPVAQTLKGRFTVFKIKGRRKLYRLKKRISKR